MASGVKTGGRKKGTANKVTKDLRLLLKELLEKEFCSIEEHLQQVESKERLELLVKLLPYALPKYENQVYSIEPKEDSLSAFMQRVNDNFIKNKRTVEDDDSF